MFLSGFTGNGQTLLFLPDVDECVLLEPCDMNAECEDTVGSFNCTCNDGFTGDGFNCTSKSMHARDGVMLASAPCEYMHYYS